jgi:hypothetical protein
MRWRGGGILGLIVLHGLWELETIWLVSDSSEAILDLENIANINPAMMWAGTALLMLVPLYLVIIDPRLRRWKSPHTLNAGEKP